MYSMAVRLNNIFFYFGVCLTILSLFNIATTITKDSKPIVNKFQYIPKMVYNNIYTRVQHSNGIMNVDIDYEPCFNWNSNLIFSWITATYETSAKKGAKPKTVSVTIWDRIMKRDQPQTHRITSDALSIKYPMTDSNFDLLGKNVTLELHWEHMPVVGPILKKKIPLGFVTLPNEKETNVGRRTIVKEIDYEDENQRRKTYFGEH